MARIFYVHWDRDEAEARAGALKKAGHDVRYHWSTEEHVKLGDFKPAAVVISLARLPSHGRAVAEWFWEAKERQNIPIVFAGGTPDKVEATRAKLPRASARAMNWRASYQKSSLSRPQDSPQPGPAQAQVLFEVFRSRIEKLVPCVRS